MTRKYTNKILEFVDQELLDNKDLILNLLNWMSESDVEKFYDIYGLNEIEDLCESDDEEEKIYSKYENLNPYKKGTI